MKKTRTITIDPKMFISKPFTKCPKCNKEESFGSLIISGGHHTKKCRECWHSQSFKLPPLDKKVIYLDQFVISNMMKAINDKLGKKQKVDKTYLRLFEKLDRLVKLQLIICPDSEFHREESLLSFYTVLKRMYEQLSHGISFYDSTTIRRFQLCEDFKSYIKDEQCDWVKCLDVDDLLHGDRNEWQGRLIISIKSKIDQKEIDIFRKRRLEIHNNFNSIFETWKKQTAKTYQSFVKEISTSFGTGIADRYVNLIAQYFQASMGAKTLSTGDMLSFTGESSVLITSLLHYLPNDSNHAENLHKVLSYLRSERLEQVPFNEIYSAFWGVIAYQISKGGRKKAPNVGMFTDIEMVSTLMPYCDAIFIDKDMHSILNFGPSRKIVSKHKTKIFSLTNVTSFFSYLEKIENKASKKHILTVKETYGEDWGTPFYEMYSH